PERLATLAEDVITRTKATRVEQRLLDQLADPKSADKMSSGRADLEWQILRDRFSRDGARAKYIVFCASPESCGVIIKTLKQQVERSWIRVADRTTESKDAASVFSEFARDDSRVLVTDATGEEGFNLQFARAAIFH